MTRSGHHHARPRPVGAVHGAVAVTVALLIGAVAALLAGAPASAAPPPAPDGSGQSGRLVPVPPGCTAPDPADVAFVGVVLDKDGYIERGAVRFQIDEVRAGNAAPFEVSGVIDVRYGPDSKYLEIGEPYLVSAAVDPEIGRLASKVSPATPLFGGNDVIGVEDSAVECPTFDDPVQTLHVDGTPVESGVLSPMFEDRGVLLAAIAVPVMIAFAVLVGLVLLRIGWHWAMAGVFALGRAAVTPTTDERAARVRRHRTGPDSRTSRV